MSELNHNARLCNNDLVFVYQTILSNRTNTVLDIVGVSCFWPNAIYMEIFTLLEYLISFIFILKLFVFCHGDVFSLLYSFELCPLKKLFYIFYLNISLSYLYVDFSVYTCLVVEFICFVHLYCQEILL